MDIEKETRDRLKKRGEEWSGEEQNYFIAFPRRISKAIVMSAATDIHRDLLRSYCPS